MKKLLFLLPVLALLISACGEQKKSKTDETTAPATAVEMTIVTYNVEGMTCEGCENAIAAGVSSLDGIGEVKSSFSEGWTKVSYDPAKTSEDSIKAKIADVGYVVLGKKEAAE